MNVLIFLIYGKKGGIWEPRDGIVSPSHLLNTFVEESRKHGVKLIENCEVTKVLVNTTRGGHYFKVKGVQTTKGLIECDVLVNCAGIVIKFLPNFISRI
jgi:glycine/D-amino acid oxidase-like deaminating enzyme